MTLFKGFTALPLRNVVINLYQVEEVALKLYSTKILITCMMLDYKSELKASMQYSIKK
jgi:hypothetical protein